MDPIIKGMVDMQMHTTYNVDDYTTALRVPGGWIYVQRFNENAGSIEYVRNTYTSTFVPILPNADYNEKE